VNPPGVVEQALQAILAVYAGMDPAGGYSFAFQYATRHVRQLRALAPSQVPAVMVARNPNLKAAIVYKGNESYEQTIAVEVLAFLRGSGENPDQAQLATLAEAMLSDLKRVQLLDEHFGVPAVIRASQIASDYNDVGWEDDGALVSIGLDVVVTWNAPAPP